MQSEVRVSMANRAMAILRECMSVATAMYVEERPTDASSGVLLAVAPKASTSERLSKLSVVIPPKRRTE